MSINKKLGSPYYYIRFTICGKRIEESTKTTSRSEALRYEAKRMNELREELVYGVKPKKTWQEATQRWIKEKSHKRTIKQDINKLKELVCFNNLTLEEVTSDLIETLACKKEATGVKEATVNRILALIKSILMSARDEWEWINRVPHIRMRIEPKFRDSWLSPELVKSLSKELIKRNLGHIHDAMMFTIYTGIRASNVANLKWEQIDLTAGREYLNIRSESFKNNNHFGVPINKGAIAVLKKRLGIHTTSVFTYKGKPVNTFNTRAWRKALKAVGIENFHWHDLRHTFATWFLIGGGTLHELMGLGGWTDMKSCMKYSHWANEYLRAAANKISDRGANQENSFF